MLKPICVPCKRFYRPRTTGYAFLEGMPRTDSALPGTAQPEKWQPYKLWSGDLWECPGCGHQIIDGTGSGPISQKHKADFADAVQRHNGSKFQVNDC